MIRFLQLLKSTLVAGLIIVLPAWLALLLLLKLLDKLGVLVKPIAGRLPEGVNYPILVATLALVLICLSAGLLVNTGIGRAIGNNLRHHIFNRVPGYEALRNIARQFSETDLRDGFKPSLLEVEDDALAPAFLIENHGNGRSTVFLPSAPTPMAGSILIVPSGRVHPLNVSVTTMMKCISKWGSGSGELLAALEAPQPTVNRNP